MSTETWMTKRSLRGTISTDVSSLVLFGVVVVLVHILVNGRYGFHRDELQTFSNARHLAWGYVEYPPITAAIGRVELVLFGDSLRGFRFFPALAQGLFLFSRGWLHVHWEPDARRNSLPRLEP